MIRKLTITLALLALAGVAFAQYPNPNSPYDTFPTDPTRTDRTSGPVDNTDYHMRGVWDNGYGTDTVWDGVEWGTGVAFADRYEGPIYANFATMGVNVFNEFGVLVDIDHRFWEIWGDGVHADDGADYTAVFTGTVGTNESNIEWGLRSYNSGCLQFDNPEVTVTAIRIYSDGTLEEELTDGSGGGTVTDFTTLQEVMVTQDTCNHDFRIEIDVNLAQHLASNTETAIQLPFYFCPASPQG